MNENYQDYYLKIYELHIGLLHYHGQLGTSRETKSKAFYLILSLPEDMLREKGREEGGGVEEVGAGAWRDQRPEWEGERRKHQSVASHTHPDLGTEPTTQSCALTG